MVLKRERKRNYFPAILSSLLSEHVLSVSYVPRYSSCTSCLSEQTVQQERHSYEQIVSHCGSEGRGVSGVWWIHEGGPGKLLEQVRRASGKKLMADRDHSCGGSATSEGEKEEQLAGCWWPQDSCSCWNAKGLGGVIATWFLEGREWGSGAANPGVCPQVWRLRLAE